jgi:hypothetical protein
MDLIYTGWQPYFHSKFAGIWQTKPTLSSGLYSLLCFYDLYLKFQSLAGKRLSRKALNRLLVTEYEATSKKFAESEAHIGASMIRPPITPSSPKGDY